MGWCMGGLGCKKPRGEGGGGRGCATHNQLHHFRCNSTIFLWCAIFRCLAGSVFVWKRRSLSTWCRKGSNCRQKTIWPSIFPTTCRTSCAAKHTYAFTHIIFLHEWGIKHVTSTLQSHNATGRVSAHYLLWSQAEKSEPGWDITSQIPYYKSDPCLLPLDNSSNHTEKNPKPGRDITNQIPYYKSDPCLLTLGWFWMLHKRPKQQQSHWKMWWVKTVTIKGTICTTGPRHYPSMQLHKKAEANAYRILHKKWSITKNILFIAMFRCVMA